VNCEDYGASAKTFGCISAVLYVQFCVQQMEMEMLVKSHQRFSATSLCVVAAWTVAPTATFAQTANANTSATVVQTTTISSLLALDFGTIASNNTAGVVSLDASANNRNCATNMACSGSFAFAKLFVTGDASSVQLQYDSTVQLTGPGATMTATLLFPGGQGATIPLSNGQATVRFGADLYVNANQAAGAYNGTFTVSVNYQ
jgi:Mat/Ecp fimbriae major subunit